MTGQNFTTYRNSYVLVADILGFREIVENQTIDQSLELFKEILKNVELSSTLGSARKYETEDGSSGIRAELEDLKVNANLFSDTIVLWTSQSDLRALNDLIRVSTVLFYHAIRGGYPWRGAITKGDICAAHLHHPGASMLLENVCFGNAIVKAYSLEKEQEWSGCMFDPEMLIGEPESTRKFLVNLDIHVFEYQVPLKNKLTTQTLALNWLDWVDPNMLTIEDVRGSFIQRAKTISDSTVIQKIENTDQFYLASVNKMKEPSNQSVIARAREQRKQ